MISVTPIDTGLTTFAGFAALSLEGGAFQKVAADRD